MSLNLDQVFTISSLEIENIIYNTPLGKSDHLVLNMEYVLKEIESTDVEDSEQ